MKILELLVDRVSDILTSVVALISSIATLKLAQAKLKEAQSKDADNDND